MALIACLECGNQVSDRAVACPECGCPPGNQNRVEVLDASDTRPKIGLVECGSCGNGIAKSASTCPSCGAKNEWKHPAITEFVGVVAKAYQGPEFNYEYESMELRGYAHKSTAAKLLLCCAIIFGIISIFIILFSTILGLALGAISFAGLLWVLIFGGLFDDNARKFHVVFEDGSFSWASNDEEFWRPVKSLISRCWENNKS